MKLTLQLRKQKNILILEDYDGTGDRLPLDTEKNSFDRMLLLRVKKDGGIYLGENKEFEEYYKGIK